MSSRIAHHIDFPDYSADELMQIAQKMAATMNYSLDKHALETLREYIDLRQQQPNFANARSIRNALDRARLRHANRIFELATSANSQMSAQDLSAISAGDIRASRVFNGGLATNSAKKT